MDTQRAPFAFRLADACDTASEQAEWTMRDGIAAAGCTDPTGQGDYRYSANIGRDNGVWC
ncbi:MAG: hypothetical protein ACTHOH_01780 [Lysobacteraceae bacterium]